MCSILLLQLVNKSLVVVEDDGMETRYRLLETIRQYARDKLLAAGEAAQARDQHLDYYLNWAEAQTAKWHGHDGKVQLTTMQWRQILDADQDNLRAALDWAIGNERGDASTRLVIALNLYWNTNGFWTEVIRWAEMVLALLTESDPPGMRANVMLMLLSFLGRMGGHEARLFSLFEQAEPLVAEANDPLVNASYYLNRSWANPDYEIARDYLEKAIEAVRQAGYVRYELVFEGFLADRARMAGDIDFAVERFQYTAEAFRALGDPDEAGYGIGNLGRIAFERGDYGEARHAFEEVVAICRETNRVALADWLLPLAMVALEQGDPDSVRASLRESLAIYRDIRHRSGIGHNLVLTAGLMLAENQFEAAARLLGAASQVVQEVDYHFEPLLPARIERYTRAAATSLDEATFQREHEAGSRMTRDAAVAYALGALHA